MVLAVKQFTVTDDAGNVETNVTVEVRSEVAGLPLAQIYSDRDGLTNPGNPFVSLDGQVRFYTAAGDYRIIVTGLSGTRTHYNVAIGTAAERDASDLLFSFAIAMSVSGLPGNGEELPPYLIPLAMSLPIDFAGSFAKAQIAATAETVVTAYHDSGGGAVAIGTATFAAASDTAVFVAASAATLNPGDKVWIGFPNPRDVTLSDISMTFLATRQ